MNWTKLTKGTKVRCKRSGKTGYFMEFRGYIAQVSTVNWEEIPESKIWCTAGCDLEVIQ